MSIFDGIVLGTTLTGRRIGTSGNDVFSVTDGAVNVGGPGSDRFITGVFDTQWLIGGSGDDEYNVNQLGITVIQDLNRGNDTLEFSGLVDYSIPAWQIFLVDKQDLVLMGNGSFVAILDWRSSGGRIEKIVMPSGKSYDTNAFGKIVTSGFSFKGNVKGDDDFFNLLVLSNTGTYWKDFQGFAKQTASLNATLEVGGDSGGGPVEPKAPTAVSDRFDVSASETGKNGFVLDVLTNDVPGDSKLDPRSITIVREPSLGAVTIKKGKVIFQPEKDFSGEESFTYTVADKHGAVSEPANVTIAIIGEEPTSGLLEAARLSDVAYNDRESSKYLGSDWNPLTTEDLGGNIEGFNGKGVQRVDVDIFGPFNPASVAHVYRGSIEGKSAVVIAFRGTDSQPELLGQLGNWDQYLEAHQTLIDAVEQYAVRSGVERLLFTGHSLGGIIAEMAAAQALDPALGSSAYETAFVTFGSPGSPSTVPQSITGLNVVHSDDFLANLGDLARVGRITPSNVGLSLAALRREGVDVVIERSEGTLPATGTIGIGAGKFHPELIAEHKRTLYLETVADLAESGGNIFDSDELEAAEPMDIAAMPESRLVEASTAILLTGDVQIG